jgi:hypothetical protein
MEIPKRLYQVRVYTATHVIEGMHQPAGSFMNAINEADNVCFAVNDATFQPLSAQSMLRPTTVPEAVVNKYDILFICFSDDTLQNEINMLRRVERVIAYTPAFALRGDFHLGAEAQTRDMVDTFRGQFQPLTDVTIFPLIETNVSIPRNESMVIVNARAIPLYHPEVTS